MIYIDVSYLVRLYVEDPGWEQVRALAARTSVSCSLHGQAELVAALHLKHREGVFKSSVFRQVLDQFELDCSQNAFQWFPVSPAVIARVNESYRNLSQSVFLRASDALHLACAAEHQFREIYSNDRHLLAAADHFALKGVNIL